MGPDPSEVPARAPAPNDAGADAALEDLQRAAQSGETAAAAELGKRLLTGRGAPFDPQGGVVHVSAAAAQGHADALTMMAALHAGGAWVPQNWDLALDCLTRAAEAGSADARSQLCIVAADQALANAARARSAGMEPSVWQRLRASVDLRAFIMPPPREQICEAPRVWTAKGVASPALCDFLVSRSRGNLSPAGMYNPLTRKATLESSRNCSDFKFTIVDGGIVMLLLRLRISGLTTLPPVNMEPPQIFHYAVGQYIKPHFDFFLQHESITGYGRDGAYSSDRIVTSILYLNDDFDGGELEFPRANFRHKGGKGDLVFFASVKDGAKDELSIHAGLTVTRGEKYILSQWIHNGPFTAVS